MRTLLTIDAPRASRGAVHAAVTPSIEERSTPTTSDARLAAVTPCDPSARPCPFFCIRPKATVRSFTVPFSVRLCLCLWKGEELTASVLCITGSRRRLRRLVHRRARDHHQTGNCRDKDVAAASESVRLSSSSPLIFVLAFLHPFRVSVSLSTCCSV